MASPFSLPRGTILRHGYEIVGRLGRGGQGIVYLAAHHGHHGRRLLALKVAEPTFLQKEYAYLAALRHPGIPRAYELFEEDGAFYMAHTVIRGPGNLRHWQACWHGPPPETLVLQIGMQLCIILDYLHKRGMMHCDLKPENILISNAGGLVLIDFGLSQHQGAPGQHLRGTPGYMAPEYERQGIVSPQTDLYSLGATLYDLFKGHAPEKGYRPHMMRRWPGRREVVLSRLLAYDPARRPESAREAHALLLKSFEHSPAQHRRSGRATHVLAEIVGSIFARR